MASAEAQTPQRELGVRAAFDLPRRHPAAVVVLAAVLVTVPYLLAGPQFLADDWFWLRNAALDGWWQAGGTRVAGRPGGQLTAAFGFGLIGAHPLLLVLVLLGFRIVAVICMRRALACFVEPGVASAIVLVWIVLPNHLALEMWASSLAAPLALALLAEGITQLARGYRTGVASEWPRLALGFVLLAGAVAFYELTAAVALLAVAAVPLLLRGRIPAYASVAGAAIVGFPLMWAVLNVSVYDPSKSGRLDLLVALRAQLSLGLAPVGLQARLVGLLLVAAVAAAALRTLSPRLRPGSGTADRLVLGGAGLAALGVAPLLGLRTNFQGLDDRLSSVSSIGVAMICVGASMLVASHAAGQSRQVGLLSVVALLALAVPVRAQRTHDLVLAGQEAVVVHRQLAARIAAGDSVRLSAVPAIVDHYQGSNPTSAVQLLLHDRNAGVSIDGVSDPFVEKP